MAPYEEVVIDGDTSPSEEEEDDSVMVITPHVSRKRRRQSAIVDDEEDEGEVAPPPPPPPPPPPRTEVPVELDLIDDDEDDDDTEHDPIEIIQIGSSGSTSSRKSRRLTILESDDDEHEEEHQSQQQQERQSQSQSQSQRQEEEAAAAAPTRSSVRRLSLTRSTPVTTTTTMDEASAEEDGPHSSTSSHRSSTRIERQREAKQKMGGSARKLNYLTLDNCLEPERVMRGTARGDDDDEDDEEYVEGEEEEEEQEEEELPAHRSRPFKRPRPERERRYADGDNEMDDFLAADDEVEYMDDDEVGVMALEISGDEDDGDGNGDDLEEEMRVGMQSRDPQEWFKIYLQYLEECLLDADLDNRMRQSRRDPGYQLFRQAIHHVERSICSRRDTIRSSVVWNEHIMEALHYSTKYSSSHCQADQDCDACRRQNHWATVEARFGGIACDARELYKDNWIKKLRSSVREREPIRATFELGSVCHARTIGFWQLLHAKHFWVALVDAKRTECGDGQGRMLDSARKAFHKQEFGRYKRLLNLIDHFSTDAHGSTYYMPNVWKKVAAPHVRTEFLPDGDSRSRARDAPRRGKMDSLVVDSDEDEEIGEDEGAEEEEEEEEEPDAEEIQIKNISRRAEQAKPEVLGTPRRAPETHTSPPSVRATEEKKVTPRRLRQFTLASVSAASNSVATSTISPPRRDALAKPTGESSSISATVTPRAMGDADVEDLLCLVCRKSQRDGAIVHGHYLHFYACYTCAKRQHAAKLGCMVCSRSIDRVLKLLPLSKQAKEAILREQQES